MYAPKTNESRWETRESRRESDAVGLVAIFLFAVSFWKEFSKDGCMTRPSAIAWRSPGTIHNLNACRGQTSTHADLSGAEGKHSCMQRFSENVNYMTKIRKQQITMTHGVRCSHTASGFSAKGSRTQSLIRYRLFKWRQEKGEKNSCILTIFEDVDNISGNQR